MIDSYHNANNTEGYRVYKDGWCECYGTVYLTSSTLTSINLPKNFKMSTTALIGDAYSTNFIETDCAQCNFGSYSTISSGFLDSNHIRLYQENDAKALMQVRWLVKGYLTDEEMSKYDL